MPALKNHRHEVYAQALAKGHSADEAYRKAGYTKNRGNASRLKANESIKARVSELVNRGAERAEVSVERVLSELAALAFFDPADLAAIDGCKGPGDIKDLPEHVRRAIVGWNWDKAGNFTPRLAPKTSALEMIGRHLSMFNDKLDVTVKEGLADKLEAARRRSSK